MRIIYHHRTLGDGAEGIHVKEIVNAFEKLHHHVKVVSLVGTNTSSSHKNTSFWQGLKRLIPEPLYEFTELGYNLAGYWEMIRNIRNLKPNFIYDRYIAYNLSTVLAARRNSIPVVLEVNAPLAYERKVYNKLYFPKMARYFERRTYSLADIIVVVSTPLKNFLASEYRIEKEKIHVIPNGVDLEKFDYKLEGDEIRKKYDIDGKIVIGFLGEFHSWHRLDFLINCFKNAASRNEDIHLILIGDGKSKNRLIEIARKSGILDKITFTGKIMHNEINKYIAAMDIAVTPNVIFYASPMKIWEYMAMAKPVIAPETDNIKEIIDDGVNGFLFELNNKDDLVSSILKLAADENLRHTMGVNARQKIEQGYTWENNAKKVIDLINSMT